MPRPAGALFPPRPWGSRTVSGSRVRACCFGTAGGGPRAPEGCAWLLPLPAALSPLRAVRFGLWLPERVRVRRLSQGRSPPASVSAAGLPLGRVPAPSDRPWGRLPGPLLPGGRRRGLPLPGKINGVLLAQSCRCSSFRALPGGRPGSPWRAGAAKANSDPAGLKGRVLCPPPPAGWPRLESASCCRGLSADRPASSLPWLLSPQVRLCCQSSLPSFCFLPSFVLFLISVLTSKSWLFIMPAALTSPGAESLPPCRSLRCPPPKALSSGWGPCFLGWAYPFLHLISFQNAQVRILAL